jgi:predicted metal-dependent HD superfamily phosphohydrolase
VATIVAFHAHPDDEVLLTGGTIAALAAAGHRVIVVVATDGEVWPGPAPGRRLAELRASAAILGADKAVHLGYAAQKRAALAAHRTPVYRRGRGARVLRLLVRSPLPLFRVVFGTEWFAEPGGRTGGLV